MSRRILNFLLIIAVVIIYGSISFSNWHFFSDDQPTPIDTNFYTKKVPASPLPEKFTLPGNLFTPPNSAINPQKQMEQPDKNRTKKSRMTIDTLAIIKTSKDVKYLLQMGGKICIR